MRARVRRFSFRASGLLLASLLAGGPIRRMVSLETSSAEDRAAAQTSETFSPAHRTILDALADFFGWRPKPVQPVAYSHQIHLAKGMACVVCHAGVDQGPEATIPGAKFCMTCHQVIASDRPEIRKIAAYAARGEDIPWQRVYGFVPSAHVRFNHAPHIRAKVACASCHGDMTQQRVVVRAVNLTMGYCVDCHRQRKASIDCLTCHF